VFESWQGTHAALLAAPQALGAYHDAGKANPAYKRRLRGVIAELDLLRSDLAHGNVQASLWGYEPIFYPGVQLAPVEIDWTTVLADPFERDEGVVFFLPDSPSKFSFRVAINEALLPQFRHGWLRLVDRIRAILRLMLIRVLSSRSRRPTALNFILVLLAASRCFGHRSEPSDHALPALTSMSAVTGATARSV
jgi:hypothetical protein